MPKKGHSCTINGIHYVSESEATRDLGISLMGLRTRFCSSNYPGYKSKYHKKVKRGKRVEAHSCIVKGVKYTSISKVAKKFKRSYNLILRRLKSFEYPDYISKDISKVRKPSKAIKYVYKVRGKKFRTLQEIADVEGVTKERIRQKMNDPCHEAYKRLFRIREVFKYKVKGKKFRTLKEAADFEGVSGETIRQKINDPFHKVYKRL